MKQLGEDPWVGLSRRYPQGTRLFGKVSNLTDYGAFVEIEQGIEGLVHVSEMDLDEQECSSVACLCSWAMKLKLMVLEIDEDRRRISLGMKQCMPNPWEEFSMNYKKGDKVKGQIKSITDFGVFIGFTGQYRRTCAPIRPVVGACPAKRPCASTKGSDETEAMVLSIDVERERISLGIKQLGWRSFHRIRVRE